jgi:hypothetical protein
VYTAWLDVEGYAAERVHTFFLLAQVPFYPFATETGL